MIRARGLAVVNMSTGLVVFFSIFVNPIALESITWKYYTVFVVLLVLILVNCYFFYSEIRGHSLEEMARVFYKDDAHVPSESAIVEQLANDPEMKRRTTETEHIENFAKEKGFV